MQLRFEFRAHTAAQTPKFEHS